MTFCLGIRVKNGLVGLADTRVTSGHEYIKAKKMCTYELPEGKFFFMTSGLRSVRDKVVTYFNHYLKNREIEYDCLYEVANALCAYIRKVADEDKKSLQENGTHFAANMLLGGKLRGDDQHCLYQLYSEGNWVEIGEGTPYHIIGETGYGKPVLDRTLKYEDDLEFALKVGCLAFDSTRISAADVGLPLDVVIWNEKGEMVEHRLELEDFQEVSSAWQTRLRGSIDQMASDFIDPIMNKLGE